MSKSLKIVLYILVGLFVLYTVIGFLVVSWAITNKLPPMLTEELNRPVSIQGASTFPDAISPADGDPVADESFDDSTGANNV